MFLLDSVCATFSNLLHSDLHVSSLSPAVFIRICYLGTRIAPRCLNAHCRLSPSSTAAHHAQYRLFHWSQYEPTSLRSRISDKVVFARQAVPQALRYFDDVTGLSKVERSQSEIRQLQDAVSELRTNVRQRQRRLEETVASLASARSQLEPISQRDPRYLALTTKLVELLEREASDGAAVKAAEEAERSAFTQLTQLIVESHGLERAYADRTKIWGILLSVTGTFIGFITSSIMYRRRQKEIKGLIAHTDQHISQLSPQLHDINTAVTGQQGKWSELEQRLQEMFEVQSERQARLLLQQRLGQLMEDGMGSGQQQQAFESGMSGGEPPQAAHLVGEEITNEVTKNVSILLAQHRNRMEACFEALQTQLDQHSYEVPAAVKERPCVSGSQSTTNSLPAAVIEERADSTFDDLMALGFGVVVVVLLHAMTGVY